MPDSSRVHDIFLLMVQISQMQSADRIWELFVEGINHANLGVTLRRADSSPPLEGTFLLVVASGKEFGKLVFTEGEKYDESVLPLLRNAVAMLSTVLHARLTASQLDELHATTRDELRDARLLNQRILDTTPDLIYIYDLNEQRNVYANMSIEASLGYSPKEIKEMGSELFARLIHPEDMAAVLGNQERLALAKDGEVKEVEYRMLNTAGSYRLYQSRETPFSRSEDGSVASKLGIAIDITEQRVMEDSLHQSQKMEAIGRLAGGIAHDFNNVLCAVTGYSALALADLAGDDPMFRYVTEIAKAADRASDLTRQLLAFSRKQVIEPKVIDLSELVESLHSMLIRLIGEDILLRTAPQSDLGLIRADPGQIQQIVLNLAINARDAMPKGGDLLIETSGIYMDQYYCEQHTSGIPGAYVMLTVSDTGAGMDAVTRERIFEPFFTTKELGRGTGMGMSTVYGIVEQSGGSIEVYSELGKGSSFKIYFPRLDDTTVSPVAPKIREYHLGQETVLIAEDEESVRSVAERLLERLGYHVLIASSGDDALRVAENYDGPIDLLLTDVIMPNMNGRELANRISDLRPNLKVLYTSGYTHETITNCGVLDDELNFVAKPYSLDTLSRTVRKVLDEVRVD